MSIHLAAPAAALPMPDGGAAPGRAGAPDGGAALTAGEVSALRDQLLAGGMPADEAAQVDLLRALAELTSAVAAVQGSVALAVDAAARAEQARAGVPAERRGRDVPVRLGLALRESPARARSLLGAARVWHTEMPHTHAALRAGVLTPWRATILVRETAHLPVEERVRVDAEVCADARCLEGLGTAALTARVRRRAAELAPAAAVARARRATADRSVWVRPAPDTMTYVTALLPVAQGVGVYAALRAAADAARAGGDQRGGGQVMADTLVQRVTGQATAEAVPVTVNLVLSDATLLTAGHEPAVIADGAGAGAVVPAQVARELVANGLDSGAAWLRRIYADPAGRLVAASTTRRFFGGGLADLLRVRDQGLCRTPYCDAPLRHLDHVVPAGAAGMTSFENGQGLCEACNLAKNAGIEQQVVGGVVGVVGVGGVGGDGGGGAGALHTVITTTSTGHRYASTAPPPPRPLGVPGVRPAGTRHAPVRRVRRRRRSPVEHAWSRVVRGGITRGGSAASRQAADPGSPPADGT